MSTPPPPFRIILPSRPVLINATTLSPTDYAFTFPSVPRFSHIVVFLLPGTTLPEGTLTGVYIQLPNCSEFKFLGAIGTEKPSAIFQVNVNASGSNSIIDRADPEEDEMTDSGAQLPPISNDNNNVVTLGLSIAPAANIAALLDSAKTSSQTTALVSTRGQPQLQTQTTTTTVITTKVLAQRIIKNAYNFLGSFAGSVGPGGQEVVPLKSFQDWWTKFERRVENDPGFLEREVD